MSTEGWGEYIVHYDDDQYEHHIPCYVDLDNMTASFPDDDSGEYWEPEAPIGNDWDDDSFEEVEFEDEVYPAVQDGDDDGWEHMVDAYGEGNFIRVVLVLPAD